MPGQVVIDRTFTWLDCVTCIVYTYAMRRIHIMSDGDLMYEPTDDSRVSKMTVPRNYDSSAANASVISDDG